MGGYDRHKIAATLENLNEPNLFDRAKAGDAGNVPKVHTVHELEELLREKALTLEKGFRGRGRGSSTLTATGAAASIRTSFRWR